MTAIKFQELQVNDRAEPLSLGALMTHNAAFAGILKTDYNYIATDFDGAHWSAAANVSFAARVVERTTTTVSTVRTLFDTDLPMSFRFMVECDENHWAIRVRSDNTGANCFKIKLDNTNPYRLSIYKVASDVDTLLVTREWPSSNYGVNMPGIVRIGVRDEQDSSDETKRTIGISVWFNDEQVLCVGTRVSTIYGQRIGFDVEAGSAATVYRDLSVSQLAEVIPVSSIDPGEAAMTGIQRALEDRYLKWWSRWDGSFYVYYPTSRASSLVFGSERDFEVEQTHDSRQLFSHLRVMGAVQWVQLKDNTMIALIGHRFREFNSPSLWSTADCVRVGNSLFVRAKEQANRAQMLTFGLLFLEPEDHVQIPGGTEVYEDFIIDGLRWKTDQDGSIPLSLSMRGYYY